MIENARRQFILVLLVIAASILCIALVKPVWGADLQGGTSLSYVIPEEILKKLEKEGTARQKVMEQSISVIAERADPDGTKEVLVTQKGDAELLVELPAMDATERRATEARIASLGKLEMRVVANADYNPPTGPTFTFDLNEERRRLEEWLKNPDHKKLIYEKPVEIRQFNNDQVSGPKAIGKLAWYPYLMPPSKEVPGHWERSETNNQFMQGSVVKAYEDAEYNGGVIPEKNDRKFLIELIAINMHEMYFTGEDLSPSGVSAGQSDSGGSAVNYVIADSKRDKYSDWSEKYINKCSAIILNDVIKSAPYFKGRIPGYGQISGNFTQDEVAELVKVLRTGSLRVEPELQSRTEIGPNLGQESINKGLTSLLIGAVAVFAFMLWYYRMSGIVACVTLVLNVMLLWGAMMFMRATITLPGLGGLVLALGMAVDANVLIYERIREEIERGKDLVRASRAGFERAMSAILDSNITHFLAGLVLYNVGVGPVRGFAVTLMLGIVTTLFTQVYVTRLCFHWLIETKRLTEYRVRRFFAQPKLDYIKLVKFNIAISALTVVGGLAFVFAVIPPSTLLGLDFTGGANLRMVLAKPYAADDIRARLHGDPEFARTFHNPNVNTVGDVVDGKASSFNLRLKLNGELRAEIDKERAAWRLSKAEALENGTKLPDPYKPVYVRLLERLFAEDLVKPASSGALVVPSPDGGNSFAQLHLHLEHPVETAKAKELLVAAKVVNADVTVPDQPGATSGRDLFVEWNTLSTTRDWELFDQVRTALADLKDADGQKLTLSDPFPEAQEIQGRLVVELRNAAIGALILSWALIAFYLSIRFHEVAYGIAAVVSLIHDVLVVFVVVAIANYLGWVHAEINLNMLACFLTIIGYSVNDTIVIFDRIREDITENKRTGRKELFRDLINRAVNQTMSRTILTSGLTGFTVLAQFLVNARSESDLGSFAFGMLVGIISGTYSTIFIASPILIWLRADKQSEALVKMEVPADSPEAIERAMLEKPPVERP